MYNRSTVFISYNQKDKPWAEWIGWQLEAEGFRVIVQDWDFVGNWVLQMVNAMKKADKTVIVLSQNYVKALYTQPEWADAFRRDPTGELDILIPVRISNLEMPPILAQIVYVDLVGLDEVDARSRLLGRLQGKRGKPEKAPVFPRSNITQPLYPAEADELELRVDEDSVSPYQSLNSFTAETAEFFFGRESTTKSILSKLAADNFVAVIGRSGSGKSSILQAGVRPALDTSVIVRSFTPGPDPIGKIIWLSEEILKKERCARSKIQEISLGLRQIGTIPNLLDQISPNNKYVVFIDQFEELFTMCPSKHDQEVFINHLTRIADFKDFRLSLIIAVRADFMSSCMDYRELSDLFTAQAVYVGPLAPDDLRSVITEPALKKGYSFEGGLVTLILDDIGKTNDYLPLLQFTLTQLWINRNHDSKIIAIDVYFSLGRVAGCLNACAEQMYERLNGSQKSAVKSIFMRLVRTFDEARDTKQRRSKHSMSNIPRITQIPESEFSDLLDELVSSRLISVDDTGDWIDMSHESLMDGWIRFAEWRQEDRSLKRIVARIESAFDEWRAADYRSEYLIRGGLLNEFQPSIESLSEVLDSETFGFCKQSIARFKAEKEIIDKSLASDMKTLASLAKTRLAYSDYRDPTLLRLYEEMARGKNSGGVPLSDGDTLVLKVEDTFCGSPEIHAGVIWSCLLYANVVTEVVPWGQVFVNKETCRSELLLDNRPEAWIGRPLISHGRIVSKLRLEGLSFTTLAIQNMEHTFTEYFNGSLSVRSFGGFLKDTNLRNFQQEFITLREKYSDLSETQLFDAAISKTSFGKARIGLGITIFNVWADGSESVFVPKIGWRDAPSLVVVLDAMRPDC